MWEWGIRRGMRELGHRLPCGLRALGRFGDGRRGVLKTKGVKHIPNVGLGSASDDSEKADARHKAQRKSLDFCGFHNTG